MYKGARHFTAIETNEPDDKLVQQRVVTHVWSALLSTEPEVINNSLAFVRSSFLSLSFIFFSFPLSLSFSRVKRIRGTLHPFAPFRRRKVSQRDIQKVSLWSVKLETCTFMNALHRESRTIASPELRVFFENESCWARSRGSNSFSSLGNAPTRPAFSWLRHMKCTQCWTRSGSY